MKKIILTSVFFFGLQQVFSQTTLYIYSVRQFCYDAAGNRTCRKPVALTDLDDPYIPSGKTTFEEDEANKMAEENATTCLEKEQIAVFPIPNSGTFTIKFENVTENIDLYIYALDGKTVYQTQLKEKENIINNANLATGKYVMALYCPNGQYLDWTIAVE